MKLLLAVFVLILSTLVFAQEEDYFTLSNEKKCFVKAYKDKKFTDVEAKKFQKLRIFAKPHPKNDRYSIFKVNSKIYATLTSCLNPVSIAKYEFEDMMDSEDEEDYEEANKRIDRYQLQNLNFSENKWYLELDFGTTSISDKNQVYPDYSDFDGVETDEHGHDFSFGKAKKSKYKAGSVFSFGGGYRYSDTSFVAFKFKSYRGKKSDLVDAESTDVSAEAEFEYKDSFTTFLIGNKFIFLPNSHLRPIIGLYAGLNIIESEFGSEDPLKFRSTGLAAQVDIGLEYFFTNHIALGATFSYEYLGTRTFKVVDGKDETTDYGFKSKMSYSNTSLLAGLKVYFQ